MVERTGLYVSLDLGTDGVAQALGVLLGPAEAPTEEEFSSTHRHLIRAQPIGGKTAQVALIDQHPPGLAPAYDAEQGQRRGRAIGHTRGHHQRPGRQDRDTGRRERHDGRPELDRRTKQRLDGMPAHCSMPSLVISTG